MLNIEDIDQLVEDCLQDQDRLKELEKRVQRGLCTILAYQKDGERYKYVEDFDSLADYAEKRLGIKTALAYKYAQVGERFYHSPNHRIKEIADNFSPSNLAELLPLSDSIIICSYEQNLISKDNTQKELRDFVKQVNQAKR